MSARPELGEVPHVGRLLPDCEVHSVHTARISAGPDKVYEAARRLDMSSSRLIRVLFRLRGMPPAALTAEGLERIRFKLLVEDPPRAFVLGIVGQFWKPSGRLVDFDAGRFTALNVPDGAKAVWSFDVTPVSGTETVLRTTTRVSCGSEASRRSFRRYWRVVGPFSTLIRRRVLRLIAEAVE